MTELGVGRNGRPKVYHIPKEYARKYSMAKAQAKYRREEWAFTQDTWLDMWQNSGVIEHMGRGIQQYCMVRKDPIEAWGPHNCVIVSRRMHQKKRGYVSLQNYPDAPWEDKHHVGNRK